MEDIVKYLASVGFTYHGWIEAESTHTIMCVTTEGRTVYVTVGGDLYEGTNHSYKLAVGKTVISDEVINETMSMVADVTEFVIFSESGMVLYEEDTYFHFEPTMKAPKIKGVHIYPLVQYKDIAIDPEAVLGNCNIVAVNIQQYMLHHYLNRVDSVRVALSECMQKTRDLLKCHDARVAFLLQREKEHRYAEPSVQRSTELRRHEQSVYHIYNETNDLDTHIESIKKTSTEMERLTSVVERVTKF